VVPAAHWSLVVTRRVQLKRARSREDGFIEGKKRFQICFVATYGAATPSDIDQIDEYTPLVSSSLSPTPPADRVLELFVGRLPAL
jgi:hypothetical protein